MTSEDLLARLGLAVLAFSAALALMLIIRAPARRACGAHIAYALWIAPPLAGLGALAGALAPARTIKVEAAPAPISSLPIEAPQPAPLTSTAATTVPETAAAAVDTLSSAPASEVSLLSTLMDHMNLPLALFWIWAVGALCALAILVIRQRRYERMLGPLAPRGDWGARVYESASGIAGPALVGLIKPVIVTPLDFEARFSAEERNAVITHERMHLRRRDHWANAFAALAQALCWFNPLVHIAVRALRMDQEFACDADSIAQSGKARRAYAEAMLKAHAPNSSAPFVCAWPAFGAKNLKERIAMLKRPPLTKTQKRLGVSLAAFTALVAGGCAWAAQPARVVEIQSSAQATPISDAVWGEHARQTRAEIERQWEAAQMQVSSNAEHVRTDVHVIRLSADGEETEASMEARERRAAERDRIQAELDQRAAEIDAAIARGERPTEAQLDALREPARQLAMLSLPGEEHLAAMRAQMSEERARAHEEAQRHAVHMHEEAQRHAEHAREEAERQVERARIEIQRARDDMERERETRVVVERRMREVTAEHGEEMGRLALAISQQALALAGAETASAMSAEERERIEAEIERNAERLSELAISQAHMAMQVTVETLDGAPEEDEEED